MRIGHFRPFPVIQCKLLYVLNVLFPVIYSHRTSPGSFWIFIYTDAYGTTAGCGGSFLLYDNNVRRLIMNEKYSIIKRLVLILVVFSMPALSLANHPVLVEGESDFDGDGLLGTDEDNDGDRIFGTLSVALAADLGAINNNGKITIVTTGRFPESLVITGSNGNVTLEAAPGVEANIDAVLAGAPGNVDRQDMPGITINAAANRRIILRNLTIRNWRIGILSQGNSRVAIDNCRVEQNLDYGILSIGSGVRTSINNSQIIGTGFRVGAAGNSPDVDVPGPGIGILFEDSAKGIIINHYCPVKTLSTDSNVMFSI